MDWRTNCLLILLINREISALTVWTNQGGLDMSKSVAISKSVGIINDELVCLMYCQESKDFTCDAVQFTNENECVLLKTANANLDKGDNAVIHLKGNHWPIKTQGHAECKIKPGTDQSRSTCNLHNSCSVDKSNQIESVAASTIYQRIEKDFGPQFAINGKLSEGLARFYHSSKEIQPWIQLTFTSPFTVTGVAITNRASTKKDSYERLRNLEVRVGSQPLTREGEVSKNPLCAIFKGPSKSMAKELIPCKTPRKGKYLVVQFQDEQKTRYMNINEIEVYVFC